jgi:hypothetical protein
MASTSFINGTVVQPDWLNDVNSSVYSASSGITGGVARTALSKNSDIKSVKDFGVKMDGTTDDTAALNIAATQARALGCSLLFPDSPTPCKVSASVDFTGLEIRGLGRNRIHIQATSAQFDVITTTGNSSFFGLYVNGGWDGSTAGQSGSTFSVSAGASGFPYNVHFRDCVIQYSKKHSIYIQNGGYSSIWNVKSNASGLNGLELFGNSSAFACTTVNVGGSSIFSDTPNGYGINMTECVSITLHSTVILENTKGIQINGNDNRAIWIGTVYQENTAGGNFLTTGSSGGIGLSVMGCFGGNTVIPYPTNWQEVYYGGNSNLGESAVPFPNRVLTVDGGSATTSTTGGISITAATLSLPPGTWMVYGIVQTTNNSAAVFVRAGATVTTNVADTGYDSTISPLVFGADQVSYVPNTTGADVRLQPLDIFQNITTANTNIYLRTFINISSGTIGYRGFIKAVKIS